jgi:hypothetical protein
MAVSRIIAGVVIGLSAVGALPLTAPAQDMAAAPTYERVRRGADDWQFRGGRHGHGYGGSGYNYGYFQPYISPIIAGSWYARPYPYHFDYFRDRWGGTQVAPAVDCPCAQTPAVVESVELQEGAATGPPY